MRIEAPFMRNFITFFVVLLLTLSFPFTGNAQKTQAYEQGEESYYTGVQLHEKQLYGSSNEYLNAYLNGTDKDPLLKEQAEIYRLMNHLQLEHYKADYNLEKYVKDHPENSINNLALFTLANYHFDRRKFKRAGRIYEDIDLSNLPSEYWEETHFKMGYCYLKRKEYKEAQVHFSNIRNRQGEYYVEANYYYGYICYFQKNYECALSSFERISGKGPKIMDLYIAQIYYAQEAYDNAINHSQKHYNDKYADEFNLVQGKSYFQQDNFDKATEYFSKVDKNFRLNDEEIYQFGFSNFNAGEYSEAVRWFVQISGANSPLGQLANYQLGQSFIKLDDKEQALAAFTVAKGMDHHEEIAEVSHFNYAKLAFELGRQDAIISTQKFIDEHPDSKFVDPARGMLAQMFLNTNNYSQAVRVLDEIEDFDHPTKKVYQKITYLRGEQLYADRNYSDASAFFKKSLRFTNDELLQAQAYFWLGEIDFKTRSYNDAIGNFNRFLNNSSSKRSKYRAVAYYNIGYAYYLQKQYTTATNYFSKFERESSYAVDPERFTDNSLRLGDCHFLRTNYSKALSAYKSVSNKNARRSDYAIYQQGIIYGLQRKPDKKIETLKLINEKYSKSIYNDDAVFEIGNTYLQDKSDPDKALDYFNQLISVYDSGIYTAEANLKMGLIYYQKGMDDRALDYCKEVVEKYPRTKSSQEAMSLMETIYVKGGRGADYLDYIATIPNSDIRITYQDSLLYESAMRSYRRGDCKAANKSFDDYMDRFSESGFFLLHVNYYKAECAWSVRDYSVAQKHYAYVAAQPRNDFSEDANLKLAESFYFEGRFDRALPYYSQLERIANSKDNYVIGLVGQMRCNYRIGNKEAAKKNAVDILPIENIDKDHLIEANLILGKIHWEDGNMLSAEFSFDYVRKESKTEKGAEAQYYKCRILFQKGNFDECEEAIFALNDDFASYEYWVVKGFILLSDIYLEKKDYFNARATIKSILDFYEGDQALIDECQERLKTIDQLEKQDREPEEEGSEE